MTILATLEGTVTITESTAPFLSGDVEVTDDNFDITVTVDDRAQAAGLERAQRLGVRIQIDRGDGLMVAISDDDIGDALTIAESADTFGDLLTLTLMGAQYAPDAKALLRSRARVLVDFVTGSPTHEYIGRVFEGYIVSSTYDIHPPSTTVVALDAAGLFAQRMLKTFIVPANSGRTLLDIITEMLDEAEIPIRHLDLDGDGGVRSKPMAPGERPILDYLRDVCAIRGAEIGFERGEFVAVRYDPDLPPVLELTPENIILPATLDAPETLAPNVTGVVSVAFTTTEPSGVVTDETISVRVAPYAEATYENRQLGDGTLVANLNPPKPVVTQMVEETITRVSRFGSLDIRTEIDERRWHAVRGARFQMWDSLDPTILPAPGYIFPDGSTRAEPEEKFRLASKSVKSKDLNADRYVIKVTDARYFFHFLREALWHVVGGVDTAYNNFAGGPYINDEGQAVINGVEAIGLPDQAFYSPSVLTFTPFPARPDALTETFFTLNADNTIAEERIEEHSYDIGPNVRRQNDAYGYGTDTKTYSHRPAEAFIGASDPWGGLKVTTRRYRVIDEDRYGVTESVRDGDGPTVTQPEKVMSGALPRPERADATESSQEIRAEAPDAERIALAGGEVITATEHIEFIESREEAEAYVKFRARQAGARTLSTSMPIESLAHKFRMILVSIPGASINGKKFYLRSVRRDAATFTQAITAHYYSEELD